MASPDDGSPSLENETTATRRLKAAAAQSRYRVRQGDHRILYTIENAQRIAEAVKVGPRRDTYRQP